jgi:hypothetical protein
MIRALTNRLLGFVIFGALAVAGAWTAIEAVARIAGREGHLLPLDYRARWQTITEWDPGDLAQLGLWLAVIAVGVILVALGLGRSRGPATVVVDPSSRGDVRLRTGGITRLMQERLATEPWVSRSNARARVRGQKLEVTDRPRASRPWQDDELSRARANVAAQITRIGLEPGRLRIDPRSPEGRVR